MVKFFHDVSCYTKPRFTYWLPRLFFLHGIWLPKLFLHYIPKVLMSCQFPCHSIMGFPLQSWNVLVLLELWHGGISCIKIYPFCGNTTHSHNILLSWIILLWYSALSMSIHFSLRDRHLLQMAPQTCTLTGDFTVAA